MLRNFSVLTPESLNETLYVINNLNVSFKFLSGGTDVLVRLKDNPGYADVLVDISRLSELSKIEEHKNTYVIGSGVKHEAMLSYAPFVEKYAGLIDAVSAIGSPQIRALASIGGNIANASPAGDSIPALMSYNAEIELRSHDSNRIVKLEDLFTGPGKTVLNKNEIITQVILPKSEGYKSGWKRLGQRRGMAISKVSAAVNLSFIKHPNGSRKLTDIKIALGAVAPKVIRAYETERFMLEEQNVTASMLKRACAIIEKEASPITDVRSNALYRSKMCGVLLCDIVNRLVFNA